MCRAQVLLSLLLVTALCLVCTSEVGSEVNWSYFEDATEIDLDGSKAVIKSLPMHQYWDGSKGSYRTGIIGELIQESHPELVTKLDQKVPGNKVQLVDSVAVDTSSVFSHSLVVIQGLARHADELERLLELYEKQKMTNLVENQRKIANFTSKADMIGQKRILELKLQSVERLIEAKNMKIANKIENILHHTNVSLGHHLDLNDKLVQATQSMYVNMKDVTQDRVSALLDLYTEVETSVLSNEVSILQTEYEASVAALEREVKISLASLEFRYQEQLAAARASEEGERRILSVKAESLGQSTAHIVDAVFDEIIATVDALFQDPWELLLYSRYLMLAIVTVICALELLRTAKNALIDVFFRRQELKVTRLSLTCEEATQKLASGHIVMSQKTEADIRHCLSQLRAARSRKQPLPNLLVCGPSGSGKSTLAQLVAAMSSVSVTVLSGNDLLSLGNQGGLYLRTLLQESVTRKKITVILIEDADVIIKSRKSSVRTAPVVAPESSHRHFSGYSHRVSVPPALNCCLYALLEGIRESSPYFCVILTSRLTSSSVDSAVLDRMDCTIDLPVPTASQRLYFTKLVFDAEFQSLLDKDDLKRYQQSLGGLSESQLYAHCTSLVVASEGAVDGSDTTGSPETDCPGNRTTNTTTITAPTSAINLTGGGVLFDAGVCFVQLLNISEGWSYRDIRKFLMSTRFSVLANDRCVLTTGIWSKEVHFHRSHQL